MNGEGPLVDVRGLHAGYGSCPVVTNLDLTLHAGEVVALLGPREAGKTTSLLTISGQLPASRGTVRVMGVEIRNLPPYRVARLGLAHVAADRSLFFDLNVEENIRLGVNGTRADRASSYDRAMDLFPELRDLTKRTSGLLSAGEQQMLVVARALVAQPKCLLVDDMTAGLPASVIDRLLPALRRVADETRCGVLIAGQHADGALAVADRGYVLNRGTVVLHGRAGDLLRNRELLEASYLGEGALLNHMSLAG